MSVLVEKVDGLKNDGSENSMFIVGSKDVVLRVHIRKKFRYRTESSKNKVLKQCK